MPIQYFSEIQIITLALIFIRVSSFLIVFPLAQGGSIPVPTKILLSLIISIVMYGVIPKDNLNVLLSSEQLVTENLVLLVMRELFLGIMIGYIAQFFFYAISTSADIITMSLGLASDQMFNPTMGRRVTSIESYHLMLAAILFLTLNGHHYFLEGLAQSFTYIPIAELNLNFLKMRDLALTGQILLEMGLKLAAPVMGAIFVANLGLGIIGRAVPQINVLITSWPINILLGIAVMTVSLPFVILSYSELLQWNVDYLFDYLKNY